MMRCRNATFAMVGAILLSISSAAKSDDTYNFSIKPVSGGGNISAFGSFTSSTLGVITSVNATATAGLFTYSLGYSPQTNTFSSAAIGNSSIFAVFATAGLSGTSFTGGNITVYSINPALYQNSADNANVYLGAYHQTNGVEDAVPVGGRGFFEAVLASGSGSGGGDAGGAPSPEVNVGLSLLLAGATVAFLRRKRGGRSDATAA